MIRWIEEKLIPEKWITRIGLSILLFMVLLILIIWDLQWIALSAVGIISFIFPLILLLRRRPVGLETREVRRAITICFTILYVILLSMSVANTDLNLKTEFLKNFLTIYLAIIAFYFGSRTVETAAEIMKEKTLKELHEEN